MKNNLEYYKVFYHVAACHSLTEAAERLSVSQPAVSRTIALLEKSFGVKLLHRTSRGICLTAEGETLFRYVKSGYEEMQEGEKRLEAMLNLELGEIHIGASDMTLRFFLLPFLERFHKRYPGIKIRVTNGPTPDTLHLLRKGRIDFGVVSGPIDGESEICVRPVREIRDIFVAGSGFHIYKNTVLPLRQLEQIPIISLERETSSRDYVDTWLKKRGVDIDPEFELATSEMIVQFALRNLGAGSVVADFAEEYLRDGRLFCLQLEEEIPPRHFCVVTDRKNALSVAANNLLALMMEEGLSSDIPDAVTLHFMESPEAEYYKEGRKQGDHNNYF